MYKERLRLLRERLGITQKQLAKLINVQRPVYSQYENEYTTIPITHLNAICNFLDVSIDYILSFSEIKKYTNSIAEIDKKESGSRIKSFRKENKLTQVKLSSLLNTSHSTIVAYEKGTNLIALSFLYTICKKYNISADYLLGKIDNPKYLK